jgi:hypothetical protein
LRALLLWADGQATNVKKTAVIDTRVSPSARDVDVLPDIGLGSGTVVR